LEHRARHFPIDPDGWGHLTRRLDASGNDPRELFSEPSLWKGPVVPFVFGVSYFVVPREESVLVFNVLAFAASAALFFLGFRYLGATAIESSAAVVMWVGYLPHRIIFGYYFAEPFLALVVACLFLLAARAAVSRSLILTAACGALSAILLLARAPYAFSVALLALLLWRELGANRRVGMLLFGLAFGVVFAPWVVRNFLCHQAFIPFTTEGGKILFQGVYLPGDDSLISYLRKIEEFNTLERAEKGLTAPEQYRYWQAHAMERIRDNPLGQLRLCVRKFLRFWVYLPEHSWLPSWKTGLVAAVCLPLSFLGLVASPSLLTRLCAAMVGGLWLFHGLVHAELRYNFPVLPLLFILSALGASRLLQLARQPGLRPASRLPDASPVAVASP
jgi:hypothetical protein